MGIGLGALNTGNNLVYMIFGMMLGFITASGVISEICLRNLEADWIFPSEIHAGTPATIRLILKNRKEKMPSFGLDVSGSLRRRGENGISALTGSFLHIPPGSQRCLDLEFEPESRGKFLLEEVRIETRFPFGFFRKYLTRKTDACFVAYPKVDLKRKFEWDRNRDERNRAALLKGAGDSFWEIRDFFYGDNPRQISWKSSAKQSRLMVRETERETDKKILLLMEPGRLWAELGDREIEAAISFAASFAVQKFREGFALGFLSDDLALPPSPGGRNLSKILVYLALFDPAFEEIPPRRDAQRQSSGKIPDDAVDILSLWKAGRLLRASPKAGRGG
jgi:uncharacterized protein (DUF58 family)